MKFIKSLYDIYTLISTRKIYSCATDSSIFFRDEFWYKISEEREFLEPFHTVSHCDLAHGKISWFLRCIR